LVKSSLFSIFNINRKVQLPSKNSSYLVSLKNNILYCECQESLYEGIPCRHEFCIFIKETMDLKNLNFAERWTKNYFSRENVSELEEEEKEEDILEILEVKEQFDEEEEEIEEKKEESEQIRIQKVTKSGNQSQSKKKEVKFESLTLII